MAQSAPLFDILPSKLRQSLAHILPRLIALDKRLERVQDILLTGAHLLGRVTVTQREGAVLDGLEVDGDTEGRTQLVVAGVPLADTGGRVVDAAGDAQPAQLGAQSLCQGLEGLVCRERDQQDLSGGNDRGERKDLAQLV